MTPQRKREGRKIHLIYARPTGFSNVTVTYFDNYCFFFSSLPFLSCPFFPLLPNSIQHSPRKATRTAPAVPAVTHLACLVSSTGTWIHSTSSCSTFAAGCTVMKRVSGPNKLSYPRCTRSNGFDRCCAADLALQAQKITGQGTGKGV